MGDEEHQLTNTQVHALRATDAGACSQVASNTRAQSQAASYVHAQSQTKPNANPNANKQAAKQPGTVGAKGAPDDPIPPDDPVDPEVAAMLQAMGSPSSVTRSPSFWERKKSNKHGDDERGADDGDEDLRWMEGSCWAPRQSGKRACDSKSYYDTVETLKAAFESDWLSTTGGVAMAEGLEQGRRGCGAFGSRALSAELLQEIRDIIFESSLVPYYSCIGADVTRRVHGITYMGFNQLLEDAGLIIDPVTGRRSARFAKLRGEDGFDLLWVTVNSSSISKSQEYNLKSFLTRSEMIELLVRAATVGRVAQTMPDCVRGICTDLLTFLSRRTHAAAILHDTDAFRRTKCYRKEVCAVLNHSPSSLVNVFKVYADGGAQSTMMDVEEWTSLVTDLGFLKELTYRRVFIIYAHSRMLTIDENSQKGQTTGQLHQLTFESFLEAIVRLAEAKALPSDREMKRSGFHYPGEFFGDLIDQGSALYYAWREKATRRLRAGKADPIWRRVDMLVLLMVSIVQYGVEKQPHGAKLLLRGSPDESIAFEEVRRFRRKPTPHVFEMPASKASI
eukprot:CAMPEP_0115827542 /NCGR_PEP_ID=MMETSP0287-20121206/99_1 /TAXON_ID=412157 /ORGANISM="Chrysochromulina rotalis, Strain UIO044" /LENGTH=561 /DNA_ID=CAMNT_0003280705 /DNA_START=27 /DNA_END=1714 /DNA_ORIENTATION=+